MNTLQFLFLCLFLGVATVIGSFADDEGVELFGGGAWDSFASAVAISGNYAIAGAPKAEGLQDVGDDVVNIDDSGTAYAFVRKKNGWKPAEPSKFNSKDLAKLDRFGFAICMSGDYAIIGAPGHDAGKENSGAAYIFQRNVNLWKQQAKLVPNDVAKDDTFGTAVSIFGNTAIIGMPTDSDDGTSSGSAYIFVRAGRSWTQQAKLTASDAGEFSKFGSSVSISRGTAIVGAPYHAHAGLRDAGAAYIFGQDGETWIQQAKLTAGDPAKKDKFGTSVSMSAIGRVFAIVGAPFNDGVARDAGAAYVFKRKGETWMHQTKLTATDAEVSDQFGTSVAIIENIALVSAFKDDDVEKDSGAAYSFMQVDGAWIEKRKLTPREGGGPDVPFRYGNSLAIDNQFAIVGADNAGEGNVGTAYVYSVEEDLGVVYSYPVESSEVMPTTLGGIKRTALHQNFPNPFNPETWLPYRLAVEADVTFRIYDVQGHLVRKLLIGAQQAGTYLDKQTAAYWDGRDLLGEAVSSGLYVYTLEAGPFQATRRMAIIK